MYDTGALEGSESQSGNKSLPLSLSLTHFTEYKFIFREKASTIMTSLIRGVNRVYIAVRVPN